MTSLLQLKRLVDDLRCDVSRQRCCDVYPRVCEIDRAMRDALGPDWRCATCAVYHEVQRLCTSIAPPDVAGG
jgi:hypothetical protein